MGGHQAVAAKERGQQAHLPGGGFAVRFARRQQQRGRGPVQQGRLDGTEPPVEEHQLARGAFPMPQQEPVPGERPRRPLQRGGRQGLVRSQLQQGVLRGRRGFQRAY
ncbi:hypothetical protein D7X12_40550 [Corallococcus sicarius]|uniref:Uncharacterized protein n=1 Tax=Corallococcus sicarius TaxID=2316726 RepID=A0A3A8M931_9BACT|nr:hypothetical protein D7X12_40550 [Corallococcus sicarius]